MGCFGPLHLTLSHLYYFLLPNPPLRLTWWYLKGISNNGKIIERKEDKVYLWRNFSLRNVGSDMGQRGIMGKRMRQGAIKIQMSNGEITRRDSDKLHCGGVSKGRDPHISSLEIPLVQVRARSKQVDVSGSSHSDSPSVHLLNCFIWLWIACNHNYQSSQVRVKKH